MPKNVQTTTQLYSSHTLVKWCSKFSKIGFNSTRTMNFQIFKLEARKGRGTRDQIANICWIIGKARELQKNIYLCFTDYAKAFDCVDNNKLWKILQEIGIPDHHTCLICMQVKKQHFKSDMEQRTSSKCLFSLYAEYIMWNARLDEAQAGIKISGRNINNLRYADDTTLMAESEEELKSLLIKVKEESEKAGLKLNIQKTKIMANRWGNNGNTERLYSGGLQNNCRWWLQPWN